MENNSAPAPWTFLTNHSHVLLCIAQNPAARMRDMAERVGITERAVQRIVDDLAQAGYVKIERDGRRNRYQVRLNLPLRHPVESHRKVSGLVEFVLGSQFVQEADGNSQSDREVNDAATHRGT